MSDDGWDKFSDLPSTGENSYDDSNSHIKRDRNEDQNAMRETDVDESNTNNSEDKTKKDNSEGETNNKNDAEENISATKKLILYTALSAFFILLIIAVIAGGIISFDLDEQVFSQVGLNDTNFGDITSPLEEKNTTYDKISVGQRITGEITEYYGAGIIQISHPRMGDVVVISISRPQLASPPSINVTENTINLESFGLNNTVTNKSCVINSLKQIESEQKVDIKKMNQTELEFIVSGYYDRDQEEFISGTEGLYSDRTPKELFYKTNKIVYALYTSDIFSGTAIRITQQCGQ